MMFHNIHNTEKKLVTEMHQKHNGKVVDRSWLCFSSSPGYTLIVSLVDWCAQIRPNVRISLLETDSTTGSRERLRNRPVARC